MRSNCYKFWSCVIQEKVIENDIVVKEVSKDFLSSILSVCCSHYYFILHDKDIINSPSVDEIPTSGELIYKTPHYHLLVCFANRISKRSLIQLMASALNVNENVISVRSTISKELTLSYFLHFNDKNKYQYPITDIVSNDYDFLKDLFNKMNNFSIDYLYLEDLIKNSSHITNVIEVLGIRRYKDLRLVIRDMWDCLKREKYSID